MWVFVIGPGGPADPWASDHVVQVFICIEHASLYIYRGLACGYLSSEIKSTPCLVSKHCHFPDFESACSKHHATIQNQIYSRGPTKKRHKFLGHPAKITTLAANDFGALPSSYTVPKMTNTRNKTPEPKNNAQEVGANRTPRYVRTNRQDKFYTRNGTAIHRSRD